MTQQSILPLMGTVFMLLWTAVLPVMGEESYYDLRPHWTEGQTTRYEIWTSRTQRSTVSVANHKRDTALTIVGEGEITWQVNKVRADRSAECTMTFDWMTLNMSVEGGPSMSNDSRKGSGDAPPIQALLKAVTGTPLKVNVASDGTITRVEGTKAIQSKLGQQHKDMMPEELDFIETASDLATLIAAPAKASIGDKWKTKTKWTWSDSPYKGYLHHDLTYTLSTVEDLAGIPVAVVDGKSNIKLEVDRSELPEGMPPNEVKMVKGEMETQVMFDLTRHEAVGRNILQKTTIDFSIKLPNATISRHLDETLQGQVLRIEEH